MRNNLPIETLDDVKRAFDTVERWDAVRYAANSSEKVPIKSTMKNVGITYNSRVFVLYLPGTDSFSWVLWGVRGVMQEPTIVGDTVIFSRPNEVLILSPSKNPEKEA